MSGGFAMTRALALAGLAMMAACQPASLAAAPASQGPVRIVSLDVCADQFVLKFVEAERILAVSPDAEKDFSAMARAARGVPVVRPFAEDVLVLRPDLVVRSYGGGPGAAAFFERAGVPVLEVGWANDIESVLANVERMAEGLGSGEAGRALVGEARARLSVLSAQRGGATALYLTPAGVTTGPQTLVHEMMQAAGLTNLEQRSGWHPIPLERLAYEQPGMVVTAFVGGKGSVPDAWTPARHPIARRLMAQDDALALDGAWMACGGWFIVDAIEAMAQGGR